MPSAAIVSRLELSTRLGAAGQGVSTTRRTSSPAARADSIVSRVWLIVPSPGRRGDRQRQPQVASEVEDQVLAGQRHQQAADPLADEGIGFAAGLARRLEQQRRVDLLAGELRRQVGGGGRAVAIGRDPVVGLFAAGGAAQQLVVGLAGVVEAG